jgi:predicted ATPase
VLAALLGLPSARPGQNLAQTGAALAALLRAEMRRRPLVICLEDVLWLDEDSRALLQGLLPALRGLPLALLLTSRYRDDGRAPALDTDLPQQVLHLGALAPQESRALAEQTLGARLDERLAALLAARSGGNPLFVEQLALDMRERGALSVGPDGLATLQLQPDAPETALPASLSAALVARLDRLAPPVRAAVQSAAVLGVEFEERVLELVLLEEDRPGAAVRRAAREGVWDAQGGGRFRFRHALLRDAAYSMQLGERLRELHARACAAIEQIYGDDLAGQVAALAYHARAAADDIRERRYLTLLGEQAFNISAFRAALACFERALALAPPDDLGPRAELLAWQARAHLRLDAPEEARARYEESLALAEAACDDIACAEAACELGDLAIRYGDYAAALAYLERAEERYRIAGHLGGQSRALNLIGAAHIALGDTEQALAAYDRALKLSR